MTESAVSRREFLTTGGALWGSAGLASRMQAADRQSEDDWSFVVLGDPHYDRPEHHDMAWVAAEHPHDVRQIEDYCRVTEQFTPRLLAEIKQVIAASPTPVRCVIQVGDLVKGLCGRKELATVQCREALQAVRQSELGVPFLITKGNHDVTGPGATEAYNDVILPFISEQCRGDLGRQASFTIEYGGEWFVFYDAYDKGSLAWLEKTVAAAPRRRFFFAVHPPVVPYNARANWLLFAKPPQSDSRKRLLEILGRHRAIVLSGHLHKYAAVSRRTEQGRFTQLAHCGIVRKETSEPKQPKTGLAEYGPELVDLEPKFSPETREERRQLLAAERPAIESFDYADGPGYAVVRVGLQKVEADIYIGLGQRLWKTITLA